MLTHSQTHTRTHIHIHTHTHTYTHTHSLQDSLLFLPSIVCSPAGPGPLLCGAGGGHNSPGAGPCMQPATGTPAVSLTGCDTLHSTINEYKGRADMT